MKQILFATGNVSKGKRFSKGLLKHGIEVLTLKDLNIKLDVEENGTTAIENALIKARGAHKLTNLPVIGMDDSLYLENVSDDQQPGLYVRRINGKTLNDLEMIEHYTSLVNKYGINGKLDCKWVYGLALINEQGIESTYTWEKNNIYMVDKPSNIINENYPLNSITKYKGIDKYFVDCTKEDIEKVKMSEEDVVEFIASHIN